MSGITYVRTMTFEYDGEFEGENLNRFAHDLQQKGLVLHGKYSYDVEYGFKEHKEEKTEYQILHNGEVIYSDRWCSDRNKCFNAFEKIIDIEKADTVITTTTKKWKQVEGTEIRYDYELVEFDGIIGHNQLEYVQEDGSSIAMYVDLAYRSYAGVCVEFKIKWQPKSIQRKEAIEKAMVDLVFNDMVLIKNIIEGRLKLKKYGFDVSNPEVDCNFKAMTFNESKCAPDIIQNIKDAKTTS